MKPRIRTIATATEQIEQFEQAIYLVVMKDFVKTGETTETCSHRFHFKVHHKEFSIMVDATFICMFVLFFILFKVYSNRKKPKQWTTKTTRQISIGSSSIV